MLRVSASGRMWLAETYDLLKARGGVKILKEVWVGYFTRGPFALVRGVVN